MKCIHIPESFYSDRHFRCEPFEKIPHVVQESPIFALVAELADSLQIDWAGYPSIQIIIRRKVYAILFAKIGI